MKTIIKLQNNVKVKTLNEKPSLTHPEFQDQTNINKIMKKYHATGMITHLNQKQGQYADLSQIKDYQSSLNTVLQAQASFMTLPSDVRKKFQNDPNALISFLADPKNQDEAIKLGLKNPKPIKNDEQIKTNDEIKTEPKK